MEPVRLGKTNLMVSPIGFGALPIQSVDRESAVKVVRYAYDKGINFFDTARGYTTSEADLGRALKDYGSKVIVATKSKYKDMKQFDKSFNTSFANLQRSYIDLFQFHIVNYENELEEILEKGGPLDYLEEQKKKGKVRHIGITSHRPQMMLKALPTGKFETVQIPLNYIEDEPLEKLIPLARSLDVGIIAMKPVAGGVYTSNRSALRWILQYSDVVPIPGMCRIEEVDDNLQALDIPITKAEIDQLEADKQELGTVFCRRCDYCMPCPNDIEASYIVRSGMIFKRVGWDKMEMNHIESFTKGLYCEQCGVCEERCPYNLPLTEMVINESEAMLRKGVEQGLITEDELQEKLKAAGQSS